MYLADEERIGIGGANKSSVGIRPPLAGRPAFCRKSRHCTVCVRACVCMPSGKHAANLESVDERRRTRKVLNDTWTTARRFADAAVHRDLRLDFEGFKCMMPPGMLRAFSEDELRMWFDAIDRDGVDGEKNGYWSITEFFIWALSNASVKFGMDAVMRVFQQYDPNRSGSLDGLEFARAAADFGMGLAGHIIFRALDPDRSGTIDYREFASALERGVAAGTQNGRQSAEKIRRMIIQWDQASDAEARRILSLDGWHVRGHTVDEVQQSMRALLLESGGHVVDLMRRLDVDAGMAGLIDSVEFNRAMVNGFGFEGSLRVIDRVFESLDTDGSGKIGYDEMFEFIRGRRHCLDARDTRLHAMSIAPPRSAKYALEQVAWDERSLQMLFHLMMERHGVGAADIIKAWDKNGDKQLAEAEFLDNLSAVFIGSEALWRDEVAAVAKRTFGSIARKAGDSKLFEQKIDVAELEIWLRKAGEQEAAADAATYVPPLRETPYVPPTKRQSRPSRRNSKEGSVVASGRASREHAREGPTPSSSDAATHAKALSLHGDDHQQFSPRRPPLHVPTPTALVSMLPVPALDFAQSLGRPASRPFPERPDILLITHGHARFWSNTKRFRSPRLPPVLSPRAQHATAWTVDRLPRLSNAKESLARSPLAPLPDFRF